MASVVLVAHDHGPAAALSLVAEEVRRRGIHAMTFFGGEVTSPWETVLPMLSAIGDASAIVLGMASSPEACAMEKCAAEFALRKNVPIALYADTWDCVGRPWFSWLWQDAAMVLTVEGELIGGFFPKATRVTCGNPLWENARYYSRSREEVRTVCSFGTKKVILCAGTNNAGVNTDLLDTLGVLVTETGALGVFSPHPGDRNPGYTIPEGVRTIREKTHEILPGADLVLNAASGIGIEAVRAGLPVIELLTPAITEETTRIYPSGWPLMHLYHELVCEASSEDAPGIAATLLRLPTQWKGITGNPPKPNPVTTRFTDALITLLPP